MKERDGSGSMERGFGVVRNVGIVIALIGLVSNPNLILLGGTAGVLGEAGRRNRELARKK